MNDVKFARLLAAVIIGLFLTVAGGVYATLKAQPRTSLTRKSERLSSLKLPAGPEAYTIVQYRRDMLKFNRRTMVAAYEKVGVRNEAWDEAAKRYLERNALAFSDQLEPPTNEELRVEGEALVEKGCTDPMVLYCYAVRLQDLGKLVPAEPVMRQAAAGFAQTPYPRVRAMFAPARLSQLCETLGKPEEMDRWRDLAIQWAGEAGSEIREADREPTLFIELLRGRWETLFDKQWRKLYEALQKNPKAHPYVVDYIGGWCNVEEAWEARGGGWASEVTEAGWRGFNRHLSEAEKLLTRAWKQYPHYPEAPGQMVYVVMGQTQDEEKMCLWFERSVTAHLDHGLPYKKLLWALRPRWGGSHAKMYAVGEACLKTGRFDTNTPRWYLQSVYDIWEDSERKPDVWKWDGVYENLTKMCEGYVKAAETERRRNYYLTLLAQLSWFTGHYEEARRAFEEVGDKAQSVVFSDWDFGVSLEEARGESYARTEVEEATLREARRLKRQGNYAQARAAYEELLSHAKSEYASTYLRRCVAEADAEGRYREGQWISLQPDAAFTGWVKDGGTWEVEPDGAIKGTTGCEGLYLENRKHFGGRLEVRGEVEFVTVPAEDAGQITLMLDFVDTEDESDFVDVRISPSYGGILVAHGSDAKSRVIVDAEIGKRANFLLQLWDGTVSTWLGGKPMHRQVAIKEGPSASPAGIAIGSHYSGPGGVFRFRNLQVRKLTEQPPAPTSP